MSETTPSDGATPELRYASRILLVDETDRLLLFRSDGSFAAENFTAMSLWFPPGGGREGDETYEETAVRELWEETGLSGVELGPCVWSRSLVFTWGDHFWDARERYFLCRVPCFELDAANWTDIERVELNEYRWWSVEEIELSTELFVPSRLADLLKPLLRGEIPEVPLEVGR